MEWLGRDLKDDVLPAPGVGRGVSHHLMVLRAPSSLAWQPTLISCCFTHTGWIWAAPVLPSSVICHGNDLRSCVPLFGACQNSCARCALGKGGTQQAAFNSSGKGKMPHWYFPFFHVLLNPTASHFCFFTIAGPDEATQPSLTLQGRRRAHNQFSLVLSGVRLDLFHHLCDSGAPSTSPWPLFSLSKLHFTSLG